MSDLSYSRRSMLHAGLAAAALGALPGASAFAAAPVSASAAEDPWRGLKLGVASYTFRKFDLADTIKGIRRVGLKYVSIKDFHLSMDSTPAQRKDVAKQFRDAGITPASCGVVSMNNNEGNIRSAFEYARDAGIPTIVCNPDPASLPILDKMVKEFDIRLAIHNHGPGDKRWPLPADVWAKVENYDPRIGLCIDCGHTARLGADAADAILKCRQRLFDCHIKDISRLDPQGSCVEGGRGVLDLKSILQALLEIKFTYMVGIEYEKDADDPMPGLAETVGYLRGLMKT